MTASLTEHQRDDASSLLEDHRKTCETLKHVGKRGWSGGLFLTDEDGSESVDAALDDAVALAALREQKRLIEEKLGSLGIKIGKK